MATTVKVMKPSNMTADDTVLHDAIAAISSLFPAARYSIDYTIEVASGVASVATWNSTLGTQPTADEIIAALNSIKLSGHKDIQSGMIQSAYRNATFETPVSYMGTTFWTDQASRDLVLGSENGYTRKGATPDGFAWWDAKGIAVPMTLSDLQGLYDAILGMTETNFVKRKSLLASIASAATIDEVKSIVW